MAEPIATLLRRAIDLVRERRPDAYVEMARALAGLHLRLAVRGEENLILHGSKEALLETAPSGECQVRVTVERGTIRALLAGHLTLNDSIRAGDIDLAGAAEALSGALDAFETFVCALLNIKQAEDLCRDLESGL